MVNLVLDPRLIGCTLHKVNLGVLFNGLKVGTKLNNIGAANCSIKNLVENRKRNPPLNLTLAIELTASTVLFTNVLLA